MRTRRPTDASLFVLFVLTVFGFTSPVRTETMRADYRSPTDRILAATWLGRMRSRAAVDTLIRLCADPDGGVRTAAVEALGEIGDRRALSVLDLIADDVDQQRVDGAVRFDGRFTRYTGPVAPAWRYDVRKSALEVRKWIHAGGGRPPPEEFPESVSADLVDATEIPPARRAEAIRDLRPDLAKTEPDWRTFKAAYQLGRLRAKEAVPDLLRLLAYERVCGYGSFRGAASGYQSMAAWALVEIADPASVPAVRRLALDAKRPRIVRSTALAAWARLDGPGALGDVLRIFRETPESEHWYDWPFGPFPWASRPTDEREPDEFPWCEDLHLTAAGALADIGGDAAREAFVEHLFHAETVRLCRAGPIHRLVPEALEVWSASRISRKELVVRRNAVAIRYSCYPETTADLVLGILDAEDDPLLAGTFTFLRGFGLADPRVSRALRRRLSLAVAPATCNERLRLIDALGRQGDEVAEVALVEFAATGRIGAR